MQSIGEISHQGARNTNTKTLNTNIYFSKYTNNTNHKPQTVTSTQDVQPEVDQRTSVSVVKNKLSIAEVHYIAQTLTERLDNQGRFNYYCKVAWYLPANKIWANLEQALKGRNPARYFSYLCGLDLA